jgi:hypothetical protein
MHCVFGKQSYCVYLHEVITLNKERNDGGKVAIIT